VRRDDAATEAVDDDPQPILEVPAAAAREFPGGEREDLAARVDLGPTADNCIDPAAQDAAFIEALERVLRVAETLGH
jgi:hypothetical protein